MNKVDARESRTIIFVVVVLVISFILSVIVDKINELSKIFHTIIIGISFLAIFIEVIMMRAFKKKVYLELARNVVKLGGSIEIEYL